MDSRVEVTPQPPRSTEGESDTLAGGIRAAGGVLRRRWKVLLSIALLTFGIVFVLVMQLTPRYVAVTRVKIDPSQAASIGQMPDRPSNPDQSIVDTEVSVLRSRDIALGVVKTLGLEKDAEFTKGLDPLPAQAGPAALEERANDVADALLDNLYVQREKSTYIVGISFKSTNPDQAARIANAFAEQYIESSVGRRTGTAERQAQFLARRVAALRQEAIAADARLAQYRAATGTVEAGGRSANEQQITPVATQLATAESEAAAAAARLSAARSQVRSGGVETVSAALTSQVISNLRAQRAELSQAQSDAATRYGPKHPESLKINQQLQLIDQQIEGEATRVIGALASDASAAAARAASLRGDMGRLRSQQASDTRSSVMAEGLQRQAEQAHLAANKVEEQAQATSQVAMSSLPQAQIVELATPPLHPTAPNKPMLLATGLIFALVLGTSTITAQELMTAGFSTLPEIERLGIRVLASIPKLGKAQRADGGRPISPADTLIVRPMASYAEAFRVLRSALMLGSGTAPKVIAMVSSLPDEGKTTCALSLARVMALSGERTLVIDADLRKAGLAEAAGIRPKLGLLEVLRDGVPLDRAVTPDSVGNLDILPVAEAAFLPHDMFGGEAMRNLLETARRSYDHVIIDTPPVLGVADARLLAGLADTSLIVVKWSKTPKSAVKTVLSWLQQDQTPVAGAIFSMVDASAEAFGALYYSKKYAQYYQVE